MKLNSFIAAGLAAGAVCVTEVRADERRFTYVYEPETLPAGALEFENWVTLRSGRSSAVGQENYNQWDLRQELEYGVTDRYTLGFYVNESSTSYKDPLTGESESEFEFEGISLENRYNVLNPAEHAIGLTLYVEGTYSGPEAEVEEKIIIGQRHGDWKWAFNLEHATEWEDDLSEIEGELGASLGVARDLGKRFSLGLELRNKTLLPEYEEVESTALYLGPVFSFRESKWWAALTVLPQIKGWNFHGGNDGNDRLELNDNEKLNIRLLIGVNL
jgi:hypothetical protein